MKLNFDYQLVDADDKAIPDVDGSPVTIATLFKRAVLADDVKDPIEKVKRYDLFLKLRSADSNTDFSLAEVALLDSAIGVYPTLIIGQLSHLLNNKTP